MNTKLGQRVTRLEGKVDTAEPLDIVVKFIEPGTMRVTSSITWEDGQWVRREGEDDGRIHRLQRSARSSFPA